MSSESERYDKEEILIGGGKMSSVIEKKKQLVEEISDKFKASQSTLLIDYRALDVAELAELRKQLRDAGDNFKVYKKTITQRAIEDAEVSEVSDLLVMSYAVAFSTDY